MTFQRVTFVCGVFVLGVFTLVSCGADRSVMPTAPSGVLAAAVDQSQVAGTGTPLVITSLVSGTACPNLQFMISSYVIKTDSSTMYTGGSCTSLKAGTTLTTLNGSRPNTKETGLYAPQIAVHEHKRARTLRIADRDSGHDDTGADTGADHNLGHDRRHGHFACHRHVVSQS